MKTSFKNILILTLLFFPISVFAQSSADSIPQMFKQANSLYQNGKYAKAAAAYEQILKRGKQSAGIYYNLGNAYKKQKELGRAILNYERALLLDPRDADINANRRFVLKEARVFHKLQDENIVQRKFREHKQFYSFDEMIMMIIIIVFCFASLILFRDRFEKYKVLWILGQVVLSTFFLVFVSGYWVKMSEVKESAIIISETEAKYEPRDEAVVHYHMHQGEKVKALRALGGWHKIERKDGKLGWVKADAMEYIIND